MMETLNVRTLKDIFELTVDDILKLEGFKEKSATNLFNEIQSAKTVDDFQLLAALNIRGIGANVAKSILERYSLKELRSLSVEELSAIDGVGPERAEALFRELRDQSEFLDELLSVVTMRSTKDSGASAAPTVCFTGKMPEKRSFYAELAKKRGFLPVDSVTSSLSLLVANDPTAGGGKLAKAAKLGVKVLSLDEWLNSTEFAQAKQTVANTPETSGSFPATSSAESVDEHSEKNGDSPQDDDSEMVEAFLPGF
jgi:DNA ligase (NAD+)